MEAKPDYLRKCIIVAIGLFASLLIGIQCEFFFRQRFLLGAIPVSFVMMMSVFFGILFKGKSMSSNELLLIFILGVVFIFFFIFLGLAMFGFGSALSWGLCNIALTGTVHSVLKKGLRWWLYPFGFAMGVCSMVLVYQSDTFENESGISMFIWSLPLTTVLPLSLIQNDFAEKHDSL